MIGYSLASVYEAVHWRNFLELAMLAHNANALLGSSRLGLLLFYSFNFFFKLGIRPVGRLPRIFFMVRQD